MIDAEKYTVRACTPDDVAPVLALVRAYEERVSGRLSRLNENDVSDWWQDVDLATNSWLLTAADDRVAAAVWLDRAGDELAVAFPVVAEPEVLPVVLDIVEGRARALDLRRLHVAMLVPDTVPERVLPGRGYREVRRFYEMGVELQAAPTPTVLPAGFSLHTATEQDARVFHATLNEAFEDHWEHHPVPFDEWWQSKSTAPEFDLSWWFVVRQGDETVGIARNNAGRDGGVYVAALGVRRAWRGRGIARALLTHTFARAYEAGFRRVSLGVDATNPTGATALYSSVGMTVELENVAWELQLAPTAQA